MKARDTIRALAEMTDEGLFERLAAAVLRIAEPLCSALSYPGVNAEGKTRRSPLDGIGFVRGADPPHLIAVHHTITAAKQLKNKWLHNPATVKSRKARRGSTTPAGDLVKSAEIVAKERAQTPGMRATLFLTTNNEPDVALVRAVASAGAAHEIEVDIWSRSRLAHVLDTAPAGQWVRRKLLGIEQEMLSKELLVELSKASLKAFRPPDNPRAWVPRQLDNALRLAHRPVNYLVAESGLGKSIACYRALTEHVEHGGYGLILPHEVIAQASTIEGAVTEALRQLHPALPLGENPLAFCSPDNPLMLVVEDINRSGQPQRLVEKIARWGLAFDEASAQGTKPWRLFCPIWPRALGSMGDLIRRQLEPMLVFLQPMTAAEARQAVITRAALTGRIISEVRAAEISTALGNDPLLIALHDIDRAAHPAQVLEQFIEGALGRAQVADDVVSAEFRAALMALARQMLQRRRVDLTWSELASWSLTSEELRLIGRLTQHEELLRASGPSTDLRLMFRHDRIRDDLLVGAASSMDTADTLPDDIVGEPFFAEVLGAVLVRRGVPMRLLERVRQLNPLALFHALRVCPQGPDPERARIVLAINDWMAVQSSSGPAYRYLRGEAVTALLSTDGPEVLDLVGGFPDSTAFGQLARLRNGDVTGGAEFCMGSELGVRDALWDRYIEDAKIRFGDSFVQKLDELLRRQDGYAEDCAGLLRMAGHLGECDLGSPLGVCWSSDATRGKRLADYLWAFARCCDPETAAQYLEPVCAAWAALPGSAESGQATSPRDEFAADSVRWAFERAIPFGAIEYLIARAQRPDLRSQIIYMLQGIDDSRVVAFIVSELAGLRRKAATGAILPFIHIVSHHWRRSQEDGRPMSRASRAELLRIWRDPTADQHKRIIAFDVWAATQHAADVEILQNATAEAELADRILRQRLNRGDRSAIPALTEKIWDRERGYGWWFYARHVWSPELSLLLEEVLAWRRDHVVGGWRETIAEDLYTSEMVMLLPVEEGERLLLKHWDHLKFSRDFVQAALYVATPDLCNRVAASVAQAPDPAALFKHLCLRWGDQIHGRQGIIRESQIVALEPYLGLIPALDLRRIADACNRFGWFALRERLLDARVGHHYIRCSERASAQFDKMAAQGHHHWIAFEIADAMKTGVSWGEYLAAMRTWLDERQTFEALQLTAAALAYYGSRQDLSALITCEGMPRAAGDALITDVTFAINRRTLD